MPKKAGTNGKSDGICWSERNADGEPSDPPKWWAYPPTKWDE